MAAMDCTPSTASPLPTTAAAPLSYAAHCSIPLSAALSVIASSADLPGAPNPFRCDFLASLQAVVSRCYPRIRVLGVDPRNSSYLALALYRLLRHLIPHTDAVAAASGQSASTAPPSSPASMNVALAAIDARIRDLLTDELRRYALSACERASRNNQFGGELFTEAEVVQPLLAVDAATDSAELSAWQLWLVNSVTWRRLAGVATEYFAAELVRLVGTTLLNEGLLHDCKGCRGCHACRRSKRQRMEDSLLLAPIRAVHEGLATDRELLSAWLLLGMPETTPPIDEDDLQSAYEQQLEQQMRAAVAVSAPWMFDAQQVQQRVADWVHGRLPSGDAVFFRRYHIRPLWHTRVSVSDCDVFKPQQELVDSRHELFPIKAGVELVDACGVSRSLVIACSVQSSVSVNGRKQRGLDIQARDSEADEPLLCSDYGADKRAEHAAEQPFARTDLLFAYGVLVPGDKETLPGSFGDHVCHGHLHGLSEQQWDEAMGGRLRVGYYSSSWWESQQEHRDDEQALMSKDGMFPARLADVADKERYRQLQRTEIRRMVAIAARLAMLDEGVDAAVFPSFQPAQMRRQFEFGVQTRLETEVAGLPSALPRVLQGVVMEYVGDDAPQADIPV